MRVEISTNSDWEVGDVIFHRDENETLEAFKVAVHSALMNQHLTNPEQATALIDDCLKKSSDEETQYYSIGSDPPWIVSFATMPSRYIFALAEKEKARNGI